MCALGRMLFGMPAGRVGRVRFEYHYYRRFNDFPDHPAAASASGTRAERSFLCVELILIYAVLVVVSVNTHERLALCSLHLVR